jgi:hypothetical protein
MNEKNGVPCLYLFAAWLGFMLAVLFVWRVIMPLVFGS